MAKNYAAMVGVTVRAISIMQGLLAIWEGYLQYEWVIGNMGWAIGDISGLLAV